MFLPDLEIFVEMEAELRNKRTDKLETFPNKFQFIFNLGHTFVSILLHSLYIVFYLFCTGKQYQEQVDHRD
jgi:hypothetical protein